MAATDVSPAEERDPPDDPNYKYLPWQSCGCGCKGRIVQFGSFSYTIEEASTETSILLNREHRHFMGTYSSLQKADRKVREDAKRLVDQDRKNLAKAEAVLNAK